MQWESELSKYERDNNAQLPEQVKIAVLLNETTGPLQQHLQLLVSSIKRYSQHKTSSWNTTEPQQHFPKWKDNNKPNHQQSPQASEEDTHQWMLVRSAKERENTKEKAKESTKEKEKAATTMDTMATGSTKEKESNKEKDIHMQKEVKDMEAMATTPTKERVKESNEQKEKMQQTCATNVVAMATMQETAGLQSSTLEQTIKQDRHHSTMQHSNGTKMDSRHTISNGGQTTSANSSKWHYHHPQLHRKAEQRYI